MKGNVFEMKGTEILKARGTGMDLECLFPKGFVIELGSGRYFREWRERRIHCGNLTEARCFPTADAAEEYIHHSLCFAGLDPYICQAGWVLETEDGRYWEQGAFARNSREAQRFPSYEEALRYQERHSLTEASAIGYDCCRVKKIVLAA